MRNLSRFVKENGELLTIVFIFCVSRFSFLTRLPIFNDESIYLDWGWRTMHSAGALFLPLYDGKTPLLIWIFGVLQNFISDPLVAGRSVSIAAGLLILIGIYLICHKYFNKRIALISSSLYLIIPAFVFYDRQALMESSIGAVGIWSLFFLLRFVETLRLRYAVYLGFVLGIGYLIKSSTLLLFLVVFSILIFLFIRYSAKKKILIAGGILYAVFITQILMAVLYFQPLFWKTLEMNSRYALAIHELLQFPVGKWCSNFFSYLEISWWYLTPVGLLTAVIGNLCLWRDKSMYYRITAVIFPLLVMVLILDTRNPSLRYLVSFLPIAMIYVAFIIDRMLRWRLLALFLGAFIVIPAMYLTIIQNVRPQLYFSQLDKVTKFSGKSDYITGWTSGYGVKEAVESIATTGKNALVGVRVDAGNPENGVFTYTRLYTNLRAIYFDRSVFDFDISGYDCIKSSVPLYFISRDSQLAGMDRFLVLKKRFSKPENKSSIGVYILKNNCEGKTFELQ